MTDQPYTELQELRARVAELEAQLAALQPAPAPAPAPAAPAPATP